MARSDETTVKIGKAVSILVIGFRRLGESDAVIRTKINTAFQEAMTGNKPWLKDIRFSGCSDPEPAVSTAGVFRMIFINEGIDRTDQIIQETLAGVVHKAIERELDRSRRR